MLLLQKGPHSLIDNADNIKTALTLTLNISNRQVSLNEAQSSMDDVEKELKS